MNKDRQKVSDAQTAKWDGPQPGETYIHYKGNKYRVTVRSVDESTLKQLVTYRSVETGYDWTRTLENFTGTVEVDGKQVPRFRKLTAQDAAKKGFES